MFAAQRDQWLAKQAEITSAIDNAPDLRTLPEGPARDAEAADQSVLPGQQLQLLRDGKLFVAPGITYGALRALDISITQASGRRDRMQATLDSLVQQAETWCGVTPSAAPDVGAPGGAPLGAPLGDDDSELAGRRVLAIPPQACGGCVWSVLSARESRGYSPPCARRVSNSRRHEHATSGRGVRPAYSPVASLRTMRRGTRPQGGRADRTFGGDTLSLPKTPEILVTSPELIELSAGASLPGCGPPPDFASVLPPPCLITDAAFANRGGDGPLHFFKTVPSDSTSPGTFLASPTNLHSIFPGFGKTALGAMLQRALCR